MESRQLFRTWKGIFSNWKYVTIMIFMSILFYSSNVLVSSWKNLAGIYPTFGFFETLRFFFTLWAGFKSTIILHSFISLIIISILFGVLASLIFYKLSFNTLINKKLGFLGSIGIFLAVFAPGCAVCGIGLASVLGIGAGFLSFLPYEGLELSIASIVILSFSIIKITNDMHICKTSKFSFSKKSNREYKKLERDVIKYQSSTKILKTLTCFLLL